MKRALMLAGGWALLHAFAGTQMGGCGAGSGGLGFIPSTVVVTNNPDSFSVAVVGGDYSGTVDRVWVCNATQADVTMGASMSSGTVDIVVYDAAAPTPTIVYNNTHRAIGALNVQTRPGVAGNWRVVMNFSSATIAGAITLDADTPPTLDSVSLGSAFGTTGLYTFHADWAAVTVNVSVGSVSAGSATVRIWHGTQNPAADTPHYQASVPSGGLNATTAAGQAGVWTVQLDFSGASLAGSVSVTSN